MQRFDLFTTIHKGVRSVLFDTAREVARTDFADAAAAERSVAAVRRMLALLDGHSEHEDREIFPVLAKDAPVVFADLQADHHRVHGLQAELSGVLDRFAGADSATRAALGQRLHERLNRLIAEQLLHMEREESAANRILWAHRTDEELLAIHGRIVAAISPEDLVAIAGILLPAINPAERGALLAGLEKGLPADAYARMSALAVRETTAVAGDPARN